MSVNGEAAEKLIEDTLDGQHCQPGALDFGKESIYMLAGIGYALLDVADAIREQTKAFQDDGIRALTERNA